MSDVSSQGRQLALQLAAQTLEEGLFIDTLTRRVRFPTESQNPEASSHLHRYLIEEIQPTLEALGFDCEIYPNPIESCPPLLIAKRIEDDALPTLLTYGHGDVTNGQAELWQAGTHPWTLSQIGEQIFGRGTADNKGQHTINLMALASVLEARQGKLGYNIKVLFEMSEEIGSKGLEHFCRKHKDALQADVFLASDGPRLNAHTPTIFLGSRGVCQFRLRCETGNGDRHSGNWGGVITNPAIRLQHALASLTIADGRVTATCLRAPLPDGVAAEMMRKLTIGGGVNDPVLNDRWGEAQLSDGERLFGCNTLEVIALGAGDINKPIGVIPNVAEAVCHLRIVPGTDWQNLVANLTAFLEEQGLGDVKVLYEGGYNATRLDPAHPWVGFVKTSMETSLEQAVTVLPNLGGTIPNHCFADVLALPTVWMPHSYPSCKQHAPDEHLLESIVKQGLLSAAGVFWDLGEHWPN